MAPASRPEMTVTGLAETFGLAEKSSSAPEDFFSATRSFRPALFSFFTIGQPCQPGPLPGTISARNILTKMSTAPFSAVGNPIIPIHRIRDWT